MFEFMDVTLWDWWQTRRGVAPLEQVTKLVRQANAGVAHLHDLQVAHCDLSMANMLLKGDLHLCISDMGGATCAANVALGQDEVMTTEYVRAPEVILSCHLALGPAIDTWAIGIVSLGLLCGSLVVWRRRCHEALHPELLFVDDPMVDDMTDKCEGLRTLTNMARLMGPIPQTTWDEISSKPADSPYGCALTAYGCRASWVASWGVIFW